MSPKPPQNRHFYWCDYRHFKWVLTKYVIQILDLDEKNSFQSNIFREHFLPPSEIGLRCPFQKTGQIDLMKYAEAREDFVLNFRERSVAISEDASGLTLF
ncbi:hypothetical protein EC844_1032 [Acinetobacter calcoaceticus]|uniref:Uncharacterized protein n=1 Tax=Acinetobacter calcoaceticus TaxID=471 RepID=A0A4R1XZ02_ACICA|nr:hypothetical protein EC844_1032 [Acinetobacter calcoaceticus]